ncbi:hypothetical protein BS78_03G153800 [Paspalum vaginatum]|nr:hypothetical protein BS78_03G153800 [Paspalum vaginatum]
MNRVERRLTAVSSFLSYAGRLTLVNSVLSSLPTYTMCTLKLPVAVIEYIDRARKHCLWRGSDMNAKGKSLVAFKKVCRPMKNGGLGVINLRIQNEALLMKHLHKFYNKMNLPWVTLIWNTHYPNGQVPHISVDKGSFWWRDIMKYCDHYRGIANCKASNGTTVLLWNDVWNGCYLREELPRLFSFTKNENVSLAEFMADEEIQNHFHIPLTEQAYQELQELQVKILHVRSQDSQDDVWQYCWGSQIYSSRKFYALPFKSVTPPDTFHWIWKSKCCKKLKVFAWLLLMDRLNTRNLLKRKNYKLEGNIYSCVLCNANEEETAFHLFFHCAFSTMCWHHIGIHWDFTLPFFDMMIKAKTDSNLHFFMEIFIIAAWHIWKQRNGFIFQQITPTPRMDARPIT